MDCKKLKSLGPFGPRTVQERVKTGKVGFECLVRYLVAVGLSETGKASQRLERVARNRGGYSQRLGRLDKDSKVSKRLRRLIRD
jgi:hypothetical protein